MPIPSFSIDFSKKPASKTDTAVLLVFGDKKLMPVANGIDKKWDGLVAHHLKSSVKFKGECGQTLSIALPSRSEYLRVVVLGLGEKAKLTSDTLETAGGKLAGFLGAHGSEVAAILNADDVKDTKLDIITALTYGMRLGMYRFDEYKTSKKDKDDVRFKALDIVTKDAKPDKKAIHNAQILAESVALTRDLVNAPPNKLYPESFAAKIKSTLTPLGVKVQVIDDKAAQKMGMGCLIAVGQASEHKPRLVIMSWPGTEKSKKQKPLAFVGKGITFDSGGLNVKPYEGMMDMKMDMGGAATVTGLMTMLARRKCKVPVVAAVALAENAISDEATRPSDIVTSYSGKTVEILNTDAEGRLVLADALTYVQKTFDPKLVVDLATLTGAIMISLGLNYCGVFANNDDLWKHLDAASAATGEKVWRMPLDESFRREMDSVFADIKNIGSGRYGGSCTAAAFLEEFIDKGRHWAHMDIAGVAMSKTTPTCPVPFASGYGVKLLNKFVEDNHG